MDKVDIGIVKTNIGKSQNTENQDFCSHDESMTRLYLMEPKKNVRSLGIVIVNIEKS